MTHLLRQLQNLKKLIAATPDETSRKHLEALSGNAFNVEITTKRTTVLDQLETYSSTFLPFADYVSMLPQLRVRQYSISSSSLANPTICTFTVGVLDLPALSAPEGNDKRFLGVAPTFLSNLQPGDHVHVNVKPSHPSFHLPTDFGNVSVSMVVAGTGVAPFRGFVQERARLWEAGQDLSPAVLFVGCRHPEQDALYAAESKDWGEKGAVKVRYAFSQYERNGGGGCQYVQDRFWKEKGEVKDLVRKGAKIFVCGHGRVAEAVKQKCLDLWLETRKEEGRQRSGGEG
ncbi:uncharacterized protein KY384_007395 [Bacidia gigantensis]|uniref:uncharacterized protein n=1 Tax=Bacidia gigantensis TaxID=2732470 RepID=UPI001D04B083|nr:uncharacterized protein KY384_007395 [Bacidia gigantensis]KAG8528477.1 hypothetical protein KY384_007395 [Bacidia gigantensis]